MPFFDRQWRLRWLGAGLAAVAAILLPLRYLQVAAVWDQRRGWGMRPDDLFAGGCAMALVGIAIVLGWSAQRAQARKRWRIDMLADSALLTQHRAAPGTVADQTAPDSVTIVLPIGIVDRIVGWTVGVFFILTIPLSILLVVAVLDVLVDPTAPTFAGYNERAFGWVILAAVMPFGLWIEGMVARDGWGPSPRFELDEFGITQVGSGGRRATIRWQEARLLEAATYYFPGYSRIERRKYYLLYGANTVMRIDPKRSYSREVRQLLAVIKEQSGLVPRQLDQPGLRAYLLRLFRVVLATFVIISVMGLAIIALC